jgi:hypothetical protein
MEGFVVFLMVVYIGVSSVSGLGYIASMTKGNLKKVSMPFVCHKFHIHSPGNEIDPPQ